MIKKCNSLAVCLLGAALMRGPSLRAEDKAPSLSLDDLGFSQQQTLGDSNLQKTLEKRSRMLKTHQKLGLITAIPMAAAVLTGEGATGETNSKSKRNLHATLGTTAGIMYFTTAYFSLRAPEGPTEKNSGATKIHRALAFIHFPAMVAAPILGYQAKRQLDRGEEVHGAAKHHKNIVGAGAAAYFASLLVMTINF